MLFVGMSKNSKGLSAHYVVNYKNAVIVSIDSLGICRKSIGMSRNSVGISRSSVRVSKNSRGASRIL